MTGNFIGGSEPNASGTPWTKTGSQSRFVGIWLNAGTTTPSGIHGNTIRNVRWMGNGSNVLPGAWSGIYVQSGSSNVGTENGNIIGSSDSTDSVVVTSVMNGITAYGISSASNGTVNIANNTIGSIKTNSTTGAHGSIVGIQVTAGANTISDNTVGSITNPNSLYATTSNPQFNQEVTGILSSSSVSSRIAGNMVANLSNDASTTYAMIRGIVTSAGVNIIVGNVVRHLTTMGAQRNSTNPDLVAGIVQISTAAGQTMSENTVHSIANTWQSGERANVTGIYFSGPVSGTNIIARNQVHSLSASPTGSFLLGSSSIFGMHFGAGTFVAQNNVVRLGIKDDGTTTIGGAVPIGILDNGTTDGRHYYHNSVYLGGTHTGVLSSTIAFRSTGSTNLRVFQNNIFVNARSNSSGTIKHYAVLLGGNVVNPVGLTSNANIFLASGVGGILSRYNGIDIFTLANWQSATGQDATSLNADPLFVNPMGNSTTVDLHLQSGSPAIHAGTPIVGVTHDFDGELRSTTTPDIGADETDKLAPTITGVFAAGSTWSAAFIDAVDGGGVGTGNGLGYAIGAGLTLPNAGVDRIYIQFSEPVVGFDASTVALLGVDVADYASVMSVSYDAVMRRGIIQLPGSLVKEKLRLGVSDAIKDLSMNALDGNASGTAGGVMDLRFNVLVGDANNDGSVNGGDLPFFATAFNTSVGSLPYNPRADWNASGAVDGGDLPVFSLRFNQSLPNAEPGPVTFPPLPPLTGSDEEEPYAPWVDGYFTQFDKKDERLLFEENLIAV